MINVLRFKDEIPTFVDLYENGEHRGTIQSMYHLNDIRIQLAEHFRDGNPQTGWSFKVLPDEKHYVIEPNGDIGNWPPEFFDLELKQMGYRTYLNNGLPSEYKEVLEKWYTNYLTFCCPEHTVTSKQPLTLENISISSEVFRDIIVTAFEGGINYWACIDMEELKTKLGGAGMYVFESLADRLYADPGFSLTIYDVENPDEELGRLTQAGILDGLNILHQDRDYVSTLGRILAGELDALDADVLIQFAVFGEQVFA